MIVVKAAIRDTKEERIGELTELVVLTSLVVVVGLRKALQDRRSFFEVRIMRVGTKVGRNGFIHKFSCEGRYFARDLDQRHIFFIGGFRKES